jgi:hypothetical protein
MTTYRFHSPPERDEHHPPASPDGDPVDIVWGAPSDEMLEAEARGHIVLVEDLSHRYSSEGDRGDTQR